MMIRDCVTRRFAVAAVRFVLLCSLALPVASPLVAIEAVDANRPEFLVAGKVTSDPEKVATGGETRKGVAADGASRLILRLAAPILGDVYWCLVDGNAPADGGLDALGGEARNLCVNTPVVRTSAGFQAFAMYRAPAEFNRGGDELASTRQVRIRATFRPQACNFPWVWSANLDLEVVRPPLVFMHGLWSGPDTWSSFPLAKDTLFLVRLLTDYSYGNASHFSGNGEPALAIAQANEEMHLLGYSSTRADVIAHSMGGLLARRRVNFPGYRSNLNFNQGYINKLFTLDTPHAGSPLANLLVTIRDHTAKGLIKIMDAVDMPIDRGAIDDLSVGSPALLDLAEADVPTHALIGRGGAEALKEFGKSLPIPLGFLYRELSKYADPNKIFPTPQHDLIVGLESQVGGLPYRAVAAFRYPDGIHLSLPGYSPGNTGSILYSDHISDLLNAETTSASFANLPAVSSLKFAIPSSLLYPVTEAPKALPQGSLKITSPLPGTLVHSGDTIEVLVEPVAGVSAQSVLVAGPGTAAIAEAPPFHLRVTIPQSAIGAYPLSAFGFDRGSEGETTSEPVVLQVTPVWPLTGIQILPTGNSLFGPGDTHRLFVAGIYFDEVPRDLSDASNGTVYESSDPEVATVSDDGLVTAAAPGTTVITARNGPYKVQTEMRVLTDEEICTLGVESLCPTLGGS